MSSSSSAADPFAEVPRAYLTMRDEAPQQPRSGKIEIKLPVLHHCSESCQFTDFMRSAPNPTWNSKTKSCANRNKVIDHNCPPLLSCEGERLWAPRGDFQKPNELVIPDSSITLHIVYPLSKPVDVPVTHKGGFTRKQLVHAVADAYKRIYAEEAATCRESEERLMDRAVKLGLPFNRPKTQGKHGIWGHYLDQLWLESIFYDPDTKLVSFFIGS